MPIEKQAILVKAYMALYDALVKQHQSKGKILGKSEYDAKNDMRDFVNQHFSDINTPAMAFVARLCSAHEPVADKKSMVLDDKDDIITTDATVADNDVDMAMATLEETILLVNKSYAPNNPKNAKKIHGWATIIETLSDATGAAHGTTAFKNAYHKFVVQNREQRK